MPPRRRNPKGAWGLHDLGPRGGRDTSLGATNTWAPHPCQGSHGNYYQSADGSWLGNDKYCDVSGVFNDPYDAAVRFGWWGTNNDGSLTKVGEYQDLDSSPFWDIDMIRSDGVRTWDGWLTGLDNEANDARLRFYGPLMTADVAFQRFLRRWDHDPLTGLDLAPNTSPPRGRRRERHQRRPQHRRRLRHPRARARCPVPREPDQ